MALTSDQYREQLSSLAPPGRTLPGRTDSNWQRLLGGLAGSFFNVDARAQILVDEVDPRSTYELLPEWERVAGLPDPCSPGEETIAGRRRSLLRVITSTGGQSRAYYIEIAKALGYDISIQEHHPQTVEDTVDYSVNGASWQFAWTVGSATETVYYLTAASDVSEPLASWGNQRLECVINRYKPAQTYVLFAYGS